MRAIAGGKEFRICMWMRCSQTSIGKNRLGETCAGHVIVFEAVLSNSCGIKISYELQLREY